MIDPQLAATGQKSGYTFTVTCGTKVTVNNQDMYTSYTVTALPQTVGKTGDRGYCSDENDIIKFDPTGATNCTPVDPVAARCHSFRTFRLSFRSAAEESASSFAVVCSCLSL